MLNNISDLSHSNSTCTQVRSTAILKNGARITAVALVIIGIVFFAQSGNGLPWLLSGVGLGGATIVLPQIFTKIDQICHTLASKSRFKGAKKLVVIRNRAQKGLAFEKLSSREQERYNHLAKEYGLLSFEKTMYGDSKGVCMGAVTHFFQQAIELGASRAAQQYKNGVPWKGVCYQKILPRMPDMLISDRFDKTNKGHQKMYKLCNGKCKEEATFNLAGLEIKKEYQSFGSKTTLLNSVTSDLQSGYYYINAPVVGWGKKTINHAIGFVIEGNSCFFIDPNWGIGEFQKSDINNITSRFLDFYSNQLPGVANLYSLYRLGPQKNQMRDKNQSVIAEAA